MKTCFPHKSSIDCVCFSPNGKTISVGTLDGDITIWSIESKEQLKVLSGHKKCVYALCFSPDGTKIASASSDGTVCLWDVESESKIKTIAYRHGNRTQKLYYLQEGRIFLTGTDFMNNACVWKLHTSLFPIDLIGHSNMITDASLSPSGKIVASASLDNTIRVWDVESGKQKLILSGHSKGVLKVCFSPDGRTLCSVSKDKTIKLWDVDNGRMTKTIALRKRNYSVDSISFSPDGEKITISFFQEVEIYSCLSGELVCRLVDENINSKMALFCPDGKQIALFPTLLCSSHTKNLLLFDVAEAERQFEEEQKWDIDDTKSDESGDPSDCETGLDSNLILEYEKIPFRPF